jgi:hypothetical protein
MVSEQRKRENVNKYLILTAILASACSGGDFEEGSEEALDVSEETITLTPSYGLRGGAITGTNSGSRCNEGGSNGTCFVPRYKTIEFKLDTNSVPLNSDRDMFATELTNARASHGASAIAGGFRFFNFQQRGWCQDNHVCVSVRAQSPTAPVYNSAFTPTSSIRRYIECIPQDTQAMGGNTNVSTFGLMTCNINFAALKAFKGVASNTACSSSTACSIQQLMYHAVAQAAGNGWTKLSSGNQTGVDFDVSITSTAIGTGDACRRSKFDPKSPRMIVLWEPCAL